MLNKWDVLKTNRNYGKSLVKVKQFSLNIWLYLSIQYIPKFYFPTPRAGWILDLELSISPVSPVLLPPHPLCKLDSLSTLPITKAWLSCIVYQSCISHLLPPHPSCIMESLTIFRRDQWLSKLINYLRRCLLNSPGYTKSVKMYIFTHGRGEV